MNMDCATMVARTGPKWIVRTLLCLIVLGWAKLLPLHAQAPLVLPWQVNFGGTEDDGLAGLAPTGDGGLLLAGYAFSGLSGNKGITNYGSADFWVIRSDGTGERLWERTFGGSGAEILSGLTGTSDGGFVFGGLSTSGATGTKLSTNFGSTDLWLIKIDADGVEQWQQSFGGTGAEGLGALLETSDGGLLVGAYSSSGLTGNKLSPGFGGLDFWIIKLGADGSRQWEKSFGGTADDQLRGLAETADGGFLLTGESASGVSGNKTNAAFGGLDAWVIRIDAGGTKLWEKVFGGNRADSLVSVIANTDGGALLGGSSNSGISGNKTNASFGSNDFWVIKIDANGVREWDQTFGGTASDQITSLLAMPDGGFLLSGTSSSGISGNKGRAGYGLADYWVVKINPEGARVWEQVIGGSDADELTVARMADDGTVLLGGLSRSAPSGNRTVASFGSRDWWLLNFALAPVILVQPTSRLGFIDGSTTLSVLAQALPPPQYRWQFKGGNLPNQTNAMLFLSELGPADAGIYKAVAENAHGTASSQGATLTLLPGSLTVADAVDTHGYHWISGGGRPWFGQTNFVGQTNLLQEGLDAGSSGSVSNNQQSWTEVLVHGPGELSFLWKVSSENGFDRLLFLIDEVEQTAITGTVDWTPQTATVAAGPHRLRWSYVKDGSDAVGLDRGWLDDVNYRPAPDVIQPMYLTSARVRQRDGWFQTDLVCGTGTVCVVVSATNFVDWVPIERVTNTTGTYRLLDSNALTRPIRYYRARLP